MGFFSLVGERAVPMAFVTTTLTLIVQSPIGLRAWRGWQAGVSNLGVRSGTGSEIFARGS